MKMESPYIEKESALSAGLVSAPTSAAWLDARSSGTMRAHSVVVHAPAASLQAPGGGENQLIQTSRYLEAAGVSVRPFQPWKDRLSEARLLHLFGMSREGLELARVAKRLGLPLVLSPICWVEPRGMGSAGVVERTLIRAKWGIRTVCPWAPSWRRELLSLADAVLPNSHAEARQLVTYFAADARKMTVVPNGVEDRFADSEPDLFRHAYDLDRFVLFVGRIEQRKNLHRLIYAISRIGLPLVVIGDPPPGEEAYASECRRAGEGFATWVSRLDHDDPMLASAYAAARVVALPSWFETPGLAALEGALAGAAVVVTPIGGTREYFLDMAHYGEPGSVASIERALVDAWRNGGSKALAQRIKNKFSWRGVARQTRRVYEHVSH